MTSPIAIDHRLGQRVAFLLTTEERRRFAAAHASRSRLIARLDRIADYLAERSEVLTHQQLPPSHSSPSRGGFGWTGEHEVQFNRARLALAAWHTPQIDGLNARLTRLEAAMHHFARERHFQSLHQLAVALGLGSPPLFEAANDR